MDRETVRAVGGERGLGQDRAQKRQGGADAGDIELGQRPAGPLDGLDAIASGDDQLGQQRIELTADHAARLDAGVQPDPRPAGRAEPGDRAGGRGKAVAGVLGVDPELDGVPPRPGAQSDRGRHRVPGRDQQLGPDQVDVGALLGRRVLHLQAGVDLEEGKVTRGREQELDRSRVDVARLAADGRRGPLEGGALGVVEERRRRLLDDLLVPALQGAVPGAHDQDGALDIGQDLGFDVPAVLDVGLDETFTPAERGPGLADRGVEQPGDLADVTGDPQAATAAAVRRLDRDRYSVLLGEPYRLVGVGDGTGGAGDQRCPDPGGDAAGPYLVAEGADNLRRRPDPGQSRVDHRLGEVGVLGQETVAGVHGLRTGLPGRGQQLSDVEIGADSTGSGQRDRLVGEPGEGRACVGVGVDRDTGEARVPAGPHHPQRYLTPVGDEHPLELRGPHEGSGWAARASTAWASRTCTSSTIWPSTTPTPAAPTATTARACATSSGVGVNTR